jgi:hypothetical protein
MNPGNVNVHWRLAQLYRGMGKKEEAAAEFEKTRTLTKAADESLSSRLKASGTGTGPPLTGSPVGH